MFSRLFFLLVVLLSPGFLYAQGVGTWHVHASYHNATRTIPAGDYIATITNGGLMLYHPTSGEVATFSREQGLNGVDIVQIGYASPSRTLILVYADAGIDLLHLDTHTVHHLAQVKQSTWQSKTVQGLNIQANRAYIGYGSGLIVVDVAQATIMQSYAIGSVHAAQPHGDYLFAATTTGLKRGMITDNLSDPANWTTVNPTPFTHLGIAGGTLCATATDGIFLLQPDGTTAHSYRDVATFATFNDTAVFYGNAQRVMSYNVAQRQVTYLTADAPTLDMFQQGQHYIVATGAQGLHLYNKREGNRITGLVNSITPNSPIRNIAYHTTYDPYRHRIAIAGGQLSYTGADYTGTAMYFDLATRLWHNLSELAPTTTGLRYANTTAIAPLPTGLATTPPYTYAVTTAGNGLYLFSDTTFVAHYDVTNAPLASILPSDPNARSYVRLDGARYDASGNLWLVNNQVDTTLRVLTPAGQWHSIYLSEIAKHPTLEKMHIDTSGRLWILSRRYTSATQGGVLCYSPGDLATSTDDRVTFRPNFTNQDGVTTAIIGVYAMAQEGTDGPLWIGTSHGPYRIDRPEDFANTDFTYTQVKIARNDGTNQADYLLANVPITAIAIDGGNRKWFGTDNDGVYVISPDGQQVLHHFTTANSPLPSNTISSIAIVPSTGEAFIGTMQGIVSYESGITTPSATLNKDDIKVFPNPVRPTHSGQVMIQGLTFDAEVKITNTAGHLMHIGRATGGTYQWDTHNEQGQPVPSGVYYILISTAEGQKGTAHPLTIIR